MSISQAAQKSHTEVIQILMKNNPSLSSIKDKWHKLPVDYVTETNKELERLLKPTHHKP